MGARSLVVVSVSVSVVGLAALLCCGTPALALDPHRALAQFGHDAWRVEDGLPQDAVLAVLQARDGYVWFGTTGGLVRFDGVRFSVFDKANTPAIRHNQVSALFEDAEGTLWAGTFGGGLIRWRGGRFAAVTTADGLSHDVVRAISQDRSGALWIATLGHGVDMLKDGRITSYSTREGLAHDDVFGLCPSHDGGMWIATGGGLSRFEGGRFTTFTTRDGLPSNRIVSVYEDRKGHVWIGTRDRGLARYAAGRFSVFTVRDGLSSDVVHSILEDRAGALWFGTKDRGLNRYVDGSWSAYTSATGLTNDAIYDLAEDREGSLWIATFGGGVNRLRDTRFTLFTTATGLPHEYVRSVYESAAGPLWIATFGGGLALLRGDTVSRFDGAMLPSDKLYCVLEDRRGDLWLGTHGAGLIHLRRPVGRRRAEGGVSSPGSEDSGSRARWAMTRYDTRNGLANDNVRALYEDRRGALWVGTSGGLSRLRDGRFTTYRMADGLSNDAVHAIVEDREGVLWLGTWGGGLDRLQDGRITALTRKDGVSNDFILSFYEDREGSLWIGTLGGGLLRRKAGRFRAYTTRDGLPEDQVYQALEDDSGNLWISCNKGLFRLAKRDLDELDAGRLSTVPAASFGVADGMRTRECSSGSQPLGCRSRTGALFVPTQRGLLLVHPRRRATNAVPPPVVIEEVRVDKQLVGGADPRLPPGRGELEFQYTGLSFLGPDRVRFRYRLEGFSDEWVDAGTRRLATYANIPPGRYVFRVTACNNDGLWNETGAAFAFELQPHFHQTGWFYASCALAVGLIALALHRVRVRRVEALFGAVLAERTRMARELHDTLAQGFAGIAIHLDSATAGLPEGMRDARQHLALARQLARDSLAEARRSVMDLRAQALEKGDLPSALGEMTRRLEGEARIELQVTGPPRRLRAAVEDHLLRIAQEAVTNALRHSHAREIRVELVFCPEQVSLRVHDDGSGFDPRLAEAPDPGHLGLAGIRERVSEIGGRLTLRGGTGGGTEVDVDVPVTAPGDGGRASLDARRVH